MPSWGDRKERLLGWRKGEKVVVKKGQPRVAEMKEDQLEIRNIKGEGLSLVLRHANELYTIPFQDKYLDLVKRRKHTFKSAKSKGGISDLEGESVISLSSGTTPVASTKFLGADGSGYCEWKVPSGSGGTVQDSTINIAGSGGLSGGGDFTTNQSSGETLTLTIADNALTFAKLADLARGSILYGNASAATTELTVGDANTVLTADGTDISWEDAGSITLGANSVDFTQLADLGAGEIFAGNSSGNTSILPQGTEGHVLTATASSLGWAAVSSTTMTVADTTDTSCYVGLFESATGTLAPKTDTGLTYNAGTGMLTATGLTGPLTGDVFGDLTGDVVGSVSGSSGSCTGNSVTATTASNVVLADEATDTEVYPVFAKDSTGNKALYTAASKLYFDTDDGILSCNQLNTGAVTTSVAITIANGGTGAQTALNARDNLGLEIGTDVAEAGANSDITSLSGLTGNITSTYSSSSADTPAIKLVNTAATGGISNNASMLAFRKHSSGVGPTDGDKIGRIAWKGYDDGGNATDWGEIEVISDDVSHASEDSTMTFKTWGTHSVGAQYTSLAVSGKRVYIADGGTIGSTTTKNAITIAANGKVTTSGDLDVGGSIGYTDINVTGVYEQDGDTIIDADGNQTDHLKTRSYLSYGKSPLIIADGTTELETTGNVSNTEGYALPRAGLITGMSVYCSNNLSGTLPDASATFKVYINRSAQATYEVVLGESGDNSGVVQFNGAGSNPSPLAFVKEDRIGCYVTVAGRDAGGIGSIALLIEVLT